MTEIAPKRHNTPEQVLARVRENFGDGAATLVDDDRFLIGRSEGRVVATPATTTELAELLRLAAAESWRVIPAGAGTWLEMGNAPTGFELIISTGRLNRLLEYEPADLTATIEAGQSLQSFNETARQYGQWIPLDPFGAAAGTCGATVSTASHGPLRCAFGTPRDWLIGLQVATIDGRLTRAGGKVVKNVAGYDLCKLYTGSFGTLAIITEMTFKLRSIPPVERTIIFEGAAESLATERGLAGLAGVLRQSTLQPAALELLTQPVGGLVNQPHSGRAFLAMRLLHEAAAVESQIAEALRLSREFAGITASLPDPAGAEAFWKEYHQSEDDSRQALSLRLSFLPADLPQVIALVSQELPAAELRAHAANGVLRLHLAAGTTGTSDELHGQIRRLRAALRARGGQLVILRAPAATRAELETWGEVGETVRLMLAIKDKYDPHGLLNPGRFPGHLGDGQRKA